MYEKFKGEERCGMKGWREVCCIYSFFLTNNQRLVVRAFSPIFCPSLDMNFCLLFVQVLNKNFYISSIEIWCMNFRKKREENILLMISSIEIIILLFSSSSLRVT